MPDTIPVTISSVVIPTGCLVQAFFDSVFGEEELRAVSYTSWTFTTVPINQKFCLVRIPNTCCWQAVVACNVSVWHGEAFIGFPDIPICECGSYYDDCGPSFTCDQLVVSLCVYRDPILGAIPVLTAAVGPSTPFPFSFDSIPIFSANGKDVGKVIPCDSTVSLDNTETWYRTYFEINDLFHRVTEFITDPGGTCIYGEDIPCPVSPGNLFGGSGLIDTTGAACP